MIHNERYCRSADATRKKKSVRFQFLVNIKLNSTITITTWLYAIDIGRKYAGIIAKAGRDGVSLWWRMKTTTTWSAGRCTSSRTHTLTL